MLCRPYTRNALQKTGNIDLFNQFFLEKKKKDKKGSFNTKFA